jgi:TPR repeat protein
LAPQPKNLAEALRLYQLAAAQGILNAQHKLYTIHFHGSGGGMAAASVSTGMAADPAEAFQWCKTVADKGDPGAQCNLGVMHVATMCCAIFAVSA